MVSDNLIIISLLFYLFVLLKLSSNHPVQMFLYQYIKKMEGGIKNLNKGVVLKQKFGGRRNKTFKRLFLLFTVDLFIDTYVNLILTINKIILFVTQDIKQNT